MPPANLSPIALDRTNEPNICVEQHITLSALKANRKAYASLRKKQKKLLTGHRHRRSMRRGVKWSKVDSTTRTQVKTSANRGIVSTASRNQSQCYAAITQRESTRRAGLKCQRSFDAMSKRSTAQRCI